MTFRDISAIHSCCNAVFQNGITAHPISWPELSTFNVNRKHFLQTIGRLRLTDRWEQAATFFSILHARLARTPCSPASIIREAYCSPAAAHLIGLDRRGIADDTAIEAFRSMSDALLPLRNLEISPLLQPLEALCSQYSSNTCIIALRDNRIRKHISSNLILPDTWQILSPTQVRHLPPVNLLIVFSPPWLLTWQHEQFLLRSPIAPSIHLIGSAHEFYGSTTISALNNEKKIPIRGMESTTPCSSETCFEPMPLGNTFREIDLKHHATNTLFDTNEIISATPFRLASILGTHFKADSHAWIVDSTSHQGRHICTGVRRIPVADLEPGHLIIMTTSGGGDMIPLVADMILKNSAAIRSRQNRWKSMLTEMVDREGFDSIIAKLERFGARRASTPNIRNWCSSRHIGMEDPDKDLKAVLRLLGIESEFQYILDGIISLRSAHQSAGHQLQKVLRDSLVGTDLSEVFRHGFLNISKENSGPTKTIYMIDERGPDTEIPTSLEGVILNLENRYAV
jgi:hypothetical protein